MKHELPTLPYEMDALEPHISRETLEYHYGKHHARYVNTVNELIKGTKFENQPLEEIITRASGALFDNAAQTWNHTFYWNCLNPDGGSPSGNLAKAIKATYKTFDTFRTEFSRAAGALFGSGWCWLVRNDDGSLAIETTSNAGTPLTNGRQPLLTCDVWEHAYYIDYRNKRPDYIDAFWKLVHWPFVEQNYDAGMETAQRLAAAGR